MAKLCNYVVTYCVRTRKPKEAVEEWADHAMGEWVEAIEVTMDSGNETTEEDVTVEVTEQLSFVQFLGQVLKTHDTQPGLRLPQVFMNLLYHVRPEIASTIQAEGLDCYYYERDDPRYKQTIARVAVLWDRR